MAQAVATAENVFMAVASRHLHISTRVTDWSAVPFCRSQRRREPDH
jgi:hypothetical protein